MGFTDEVKNRAEPAGDKAEDALDAAKDKASDVLDDLKKTFDTDGDGETSFGEVVETVKTKAGELFEDVKDKVSGDKSADEAAVAEPAVAPPPAAAFDAPPTQEPVEDFAAAGPAVTEPVPAPSGDDSIDAVQEEAEELERKSQPGTL